MAIKCTLDIGTKEGESRQILFYQLIITSICILFCSLWHRFQYTFFRRESSASTTWYIFSLLIKIDID